MEVYIPLFQSLVPLAQTLVWIGLLCFVAWRYKSHIASILSAIQKRIERGSSFKAGPLELGEDLKALEHVAPTPAPAVSDPSDWSTERDEIYQQNKNIFLVHVIEPSREPGQHYDVFIYLVGHKSRTLDDIEFAEFFLGAYWGNKVFVETKKNGLIGMSTSAYGPFLCTCRVTFKNGEKTHLHRYIDFEMGRAFANR